MVCAAALLVAGACGGDELPSGPTAVYLTVRNAAGAPHPFQVRLVPLATGGTLGDGGIPTRVPYLFMVPQPATPGAVPASVLGTLNIEAPASGADTMQVQGHGRDRDGRDVSYGVVRVLLVNGKQVRATLTLEALGGAMRDGGAPDGGGDGGAATAPDDGGADGAAAAPDAADADPRGGLQGDGGVG